jgi:small GTP-binding protein
MSRGDFTVALVGRPNVGKSTLFNRIAGKRRAITFDEPGITRDLVALPVEYDGRRFQIIDTGGYVARSEDDVLQKVVGQVLRAIYESDLVVFLVDSRDGLLPLDKEIAGMLRERGKPFLLAANKVDSRRGAKGSNSSTRCRWTGSTRSRRSTGPGCPTCWTRSWPACRTRRRKRSRSRRRRRESRGSRWSGAPTSASPPS